MNAAPPPTSTAPLLGDLLAHSLAEIPASLRQPNPPPPEYRAREQTQGRGTVQFATEFHHLPHYGHFRGVTITSPVVEIVNLFFFPAAHRAVPIFAMEFVRIGPRGVVAVMDCRGSDEDRIAANLAKELLTTAHQHFPHLHNASDPPPWYEEARSGNDFFIRPPDLTLFDDLVACHHFLWQNYLHALRKSPDSSDAPDENSLRTNFTAHYKEHHRINSPGIPFLHRVFGPAWSDQFLREYLFG